MRYPAFYIEQDRPCAPSFGIVLRVPAKEDILRAPEAWAVIMSSNGLTIQMTAVSVRMKICVMGISS